MKLGDEFDKIFGSKFYPVVWAEASAVLETEDDAVLGICGYSKRVFRVASPNDIFTLLIINDICIDSEKEECEEQGGCLDFDCPLNKTTPESFKRRLGIRRLPAKAKENFGKRIGYNAAPDGQLQSFVEVFVKLPRGGYVLERILPYVLRELYEEVTHETK